MTMQVDKARLDEMDDLIDAVNIGARAIYANGPSIGQDTEDGYDAQSEGYKHKARAIAHVVLMATAARPELRSLRSTEGKEGAKAVSVPLDPTDEMIAAGVGVDFSNEDERATVINVWHAMVAAVPVLPWPDGPKGRPRRTHEVARMTETVELTLLDEIKRLRPHYQSNSMLDVGRRQLLDHLEQFAFTRSDPAVRDRVTDEAEPTWRDLALQFDGNRIEARELLGALNAVDTSPDLSRLSARIRQFLAAPPLSGEAVLAQRIAALRTSPTEPASGWMSMDSAPKDGRHCILSVPEQSGFIYFRAGSLSVRSMECGSPRQRAAVGMDAQRSVASFDVPSGQGATMNKLTKAQVLEAVDKACSPDSAYINDEVQKMHRAYIRCGGAGHAPRVSLVLSRLNALAEDGMLDKSSLTNGYYGYRWTITSAGRAALTSNQEGNDEA